ncbi:MAG: adenine phosphoribosyltransferase [Chthoniobacter sp.]|jgi:adenine phosphoribosyltransferase|nr:adenine phosphoribosyltransferase [Chthoniobacter sp.]
MSPADLQRLQRAIRDVPDFPKPGILFKDITPVLADGALFRLAVAWFVEAARAVRPDKIAGIDARGFIFGGAVAHELGLGFVPVRKKGKLPWQCQSATYSLEYGEAAVEVHIDAVNPGERVVIVDDLLATGGTASAAIQLVRLLGGEVVQALFMVELGFLSGRLKLDSTPVDALLSY